MGKIRGDVKVLGVANLLQMLSLNKSEGYLAIEQDKQKKVIHFGPAGMRLMHAGSRRRHPLGEILVRTGRLTHAQLEEILEEQARTGQRFGEVVARRGVIAESDIEGALREQAAEEIYDLFTWSASTFEFTEAPGADPPEDGPLSYVTLDSNVMSVMLEAARRADEMARIQVQIPDLKLVVERLDKPVPMDSPEIDRAALEAILPLIDGDRSINQLVNDSLFPKFGVLRTLYALLQTGAIKLRERKSGITVRRAPGWAAQRPAPRGRSVLLLSDLPNFRTALSVCIRSAGLDVIEGQSSTDVGDLLSRYRVDVIVLDISIETDNGLALCGRLREMATVPYIVLSGNTSKQAVINAVQAGARSVLIKPVKESLLLERISNVLKG